MDDSTYLEPVGNAHLLSVYVVLLSLEVLTHSRWVATKIMTAHVSAHSFSPSFKSVLAIWRL